jgi:hypothetical protein
MEVLVVCACNALVFVYSLEADPPAATMHSPVMKLASSDAKNATTLPISSGFPSLPIGMVFSVSSFAVSDSQS